MGGFRRVIIRVAEVLLILGIIVATIVGCEIGSAFGHRYGVRIAFAAGWPSSYLAGFQLLGGLIGFIVSVVSAAALFALSEIASNTRELVAISRSTGFPAAASDVRRAADGYPRPAP